jgi:hypothetical protein
MLHTTFKLLRENGACPEGYRKLAKSLGGVQKYGASTPIPLLRVLESNGLDDALWSLRAVLPEEEADRDRIARLFACRCVRETPLTDGRKVWDLLPDGRSRAAVKVAERFAVGDATKKEMEAATEAAWAAAREAAREAAWGAAREAAWAAAREAAWEAAWTAARTAAWEAAWAAAREAAWEAARTVAWTAARTAARTAALGAAREAQTEFFRQALAGRKEKA